MQTIQFTAPFEPVAQPRQRHAVIKKGKKKGSIVNYIPGDDPVVAFKQAIQIYARQAYHCTPLITPIIIDITAVFSRPKYMIKSNGDNKRCWKQTKPDWDNLGKSVCDALNGIIYKDDAQIVEGRVRKYYGDAIENGSVTIKITEATQ